MITVTIDNFQSIESLKIRIDGFTCLVGPTGIGKSAIVRAIRYALTGESGTSFVRHNARCERQLKGVAKCDCFAKVTLEGPDWIIDWERGDTRNLYEVTRDGVTTKYSAVDRELPFLAPQFSRIVLGDEKVLLQVADQYDPLFLLNQRGSVVADALSDSTSLNDCGKVADLVSADKKSAVSLRNVRDKDLKQANKDLQLFDGLDRQIQSRQKLHVHLLQLRSQQETTQKLEGWENRCSATENALSLLEAALKPTLPASAPLTKAAQEAERLWSWTSKVQVAILTARALAGIDKLPSVSAPNAEAAFKTARFYEQHVTLTGSVERLEAALEKPLRVGAPDPKKAAQAAGFLSRRESLLGAVTALEAATETPLPDLAALAASVEKLVQTEIALQKVKAVQVLEASIPEEPLPSVPEAPDLAKVERLAGWVSRILTLSKESTALKSQMAALSEELSKIETELTQFERCPTCQQPISLEGSCG